MNKCQFCEKPTTQPQSYTSMILPQIEMEELIDKWGRNNWFDNLERDDLTSYQTKELNDMVTYDQLLYTIGKGYICSYCIELENKLLEKYYPEGE
tara:strand:+ start:1314 stop:1598 length:285 start_codon:yes stop_codon:yes gene_type:complete